MKHGEGGGLVCRGLGVVRCGNQSLHPAVRCDSNKFQQCTDPVERLLVETISYVSKAARRPSLLE